jgi:hypothetical protein
VVQALCGIQAQELPAAALAIRPRSAGLVADQVVQAREQERSIIRTWGQRGTLHLLTVEDLRWLLPLFGPIFSKGNRRRRAELGLDEEKSVRGSHLLQHILTERGPLTRAEIVARLAEKGLKLEGQATPHLLGYCAMQGLICFGPEVEGEPTYVLLQDWLRDWQVATQPASVAYAELTLRYLAAYGPAQPADLANWSGLPLKEIRAAWQQVNDQLLEVEIDHQPAWMLETHRNWLDDLAGDETTIRLLPRYDTYLLGYRNRSLQVETHYAKRVNAGGGIIHPTLLIDGQVAGLWHMQKQKERLVVKLEPFAALTPDQHSKVVIEIQDLARFLGISVNWQV